MVETAMAQVSILYSEDTEYQISEPPWPITPADEERAFHKFVEEIYSREKVKGYFEEIKEGVYVFRSCKVS
jgi:hypothetical protein